SVSVRPRPEGSVRRRRSGVRATCSGRCAGKPVPIPPQSRMSPVRLSWATCSRCLLTIICKVLARRFVPRSSLPPRLPTTIQTAIPALRTRGRLRHLASCYSISTRLLPLVQEQSRTQRRQSDEVAIDHTQGLLGLCRRPGTHLHGVVCGTRIGPGQV